MGLISLGLAALLALAMLFGLPALIDLPAVKAEIEHKVSRAVDGKVTWEALDIRLLPRPRALFRGVKVDIPGTLSEQAEQVEVRLRLVPLFSGHADIASLSIVQPVIRIDIAPSTSPTSAPAGDPIAAYRSALAPVVQALREFAPDAVLESSGEGSIEVRAAGMPSLELHKLSARVRTTSNGADLEMQSTSNWWDGVKVMGHLAYADLAASLSIDATSVKPQPWLDYALSGSGVAVRIPDAKLHAQARTDAKSSLNLEFELGVAAIELEYGARRLAFADSNVKGSAAMSARESELSLSAVRLGSLVPAGQAKFHMNNDGRQPELDIEIPRADVVALRDMVDAFVGDNPVARRSLARVHGGEITDLRLTARAQSWSELLDVDHMRASAILAHGVFVLPSIEQEARDVASHIELADGILEVKHGRTTMPRGRLTDATVRYSLRDDAISASAGFDLDLAQGLKAADELLPQEAARVLQRFESATGRLQGRTDLTVTPEKWNAAVDIPHSNATVRVRQLPWPVTLQAGHFSFSATRIDVRGVRAAVGRSSVSDLNAEFTLGSQTRLKAASGNAKVDLDEIYPWLRAQPAFAESLQDIPAVKGTARIALSNLSGRLDQLSALTYQLSVSPEHVSIDAKQLPGSLALDGGTINLDASGITFDRLAGAMLDGRVVASGGTADYRGKPLLIEGITGEARIGENVMHWIWQRAGAPSRLELKTPMHLAIQRATWSGDRLDELQGTAQFIPGPVVAVNLAWRPGVLEVHRMTLKDHITDATLVFLLKNRVLQAQLAGSLFTHSVANMLKQPHESSGHAVGNLSMTIDFQHPERTILSGSLQADGIDLSRVLDKPIRIDHLDATADGGMLRVRESMVTWAEQIVTIKGEFGRGEHGLVIDAQLDSPGMVIDAMWPAAGAPGALEPAPRVSRDGRKYTDMWPLPITGRIRVRSNFIDYRQYHIEPASATVTLSPERARLEVHDAKLCGISFPLVADALPQGFAISAHLRAQEQRVQESARCFTKERVLLTGKFDVRADINTFGTQEQLLDNLNGSFRFESRDGKIMKFALIGNILAVTDVVGLFKRGGPHLDGRGFPYRKLVFDGSYKGAKIIVKEFSLDSSAVGLAATGSIQLGTRDSQLTVLVAPFSMLDRVVRSVPIIGYLIGGTFTSVPVAVSGDIRDPTVVPLSPRAVGSEVAGIFQRAFKLPGKLFEPGSPRSQASPSAVPQ